MFYSILRQIVATAFKVYFRKIYFVGKEQVPSTGPLLIAANHPMAFSEACLLACFLDRPLHFLVRGDVFKSNWNWFFRLTNQIPIYRFRDGFSNMRKNSDSFDWAYEALADQKAILIFAEGNTKLQKKLSPLQKGVARLAFGAYENRGVGNIQVVPVGINYTDGPVFRSDVMVQIGQPLRVDDYLADFKEDRHETTRSFTSQLHTLMKPLVIHVANSEDEPLANQLFARAADRRAFDPWPILDPDPTPFLEEKRLADQLNQWSERTKENARSSLPKNRPLARKFILQDVSRIILLLLFLPVALIGFLINSVPFYLAKGICEKKVKQIEFYTPVRITLMIVTFSVYGFLLFTIIAIYFGWHALWILPILMISGYTTILWYELWRNPRFLAKHQAGQQHSQPEL